MEQPYETQLLFIFLDFLSLLLILWSRVLTTAAVTLFVSAVSVGCFASFGDGWCVDIVVLSGFGCFDLVQAVTAAAIAATMYNVR